MENATCKNEQLELTIRTKRKVRFKAGADLSGKVNRVAVEVHEDAQDNHQSMEIKIHLFSEVCSKNLQD
jgi:hypothetical protein